MKINNNTLIASHKGVTGMWNYYLARMARMGITVLSLTLIMAFLPRESSAQTGTITGTVTDMQTGDPLPQARVVIEATGHSATTDEHGRYILRRVPSGNHTLLVRFTGYGSEHVSVPVRSGQRMVQSAELQPEFGDGDAIFAGAAHRGQVRALNSKHRSETIKSSLSSEQMDHFADYTVRDAIIRLPGVQAGAGGAFTIRGTGWDRYNVTVDGVRLATTDRAERSVDLGIISTDLIRELEIIKTVTPDMDADALGGTVNLRTFRPVGGEREIDMRIGGGANTAYVDFTGPDSRASLYYSESYTEEFALAINVSHQRRNRTWESLGITYGVDDFGSGPEDVLGRVSPTFTSSERSIFGARLQLTYQPSDRDTYYFNSLVNIDDRENIQHDINFLANENWVDPSTVSNGIYRYHVGVQDIASQNYTFMGGGRHNFNVLTLEYELDWSRSFLDHESISLPFEATGQAYSLNMSDRSRPSFTFTDTGGPLIGEMRLRPITRITDVHVDNSFSGRFDIEIPFGPGAFKIGSLARRKVKDTNTLGAYTEQRMTYLRGIVPISSFDNDDAGRNVLGQYNVPWLVEAPSARKFVAAHAAVMTRDTDFFRINSDVKGYHITEDVYGGYGMLTYETGPLTLLGGARMEYTDLETTGRLVYLNRFGRFQQTTDTTRTSSYLNLFPNAHVIFSPTDMTSIRAAYSKSMNRPGFQALAPFQLGSLQDTTLFHSDVSLEPALSNNVDLQLDHMLIDGGVVSAGLFYKDLSNIIVLEERTINVEEGDFVTMDQIFSGTDETVLPVNETVYTNSGNGATVYGLELSWQQKLSFLPGFLSRFGTYANYTWSDSKFETDRGQDVRLPYQSEHVVNAALNYTQGRVFTQVSYHWTSEALVSLGPEGPAPSVSSGDVYLDRYQEGWTDLSFAFRFRVTDRFRLWVDVYNLLNAEYVQYQHTREYYPTLIDKKDGRGFRTGLRFNL